MFDNKTQNPFHKQTSNASTVNHSNGDGNPSPPPGETIINLKVDNSSVQAAATTAQILPAPPVPVAQSVHLTQSLAN